MDTSTIGNTKKSDGKQSSLAVNHYHSEISLPGCMPDHSDAFTTARNAVEDLKDILESEDYTMKVWTDPFLAVFKWPGKPSTLNCYAYECNDPECVVTWQMLELLQKGGDENGKEETGSMRGL
jgi:hypothetical protein